MINETDINDWEMLTVPLKLDTLKKGDVFTVLNDDKVLKYITAINDIIVAVIVDANNEVCKDVILPNFMKVNLWVSKKNESLRNTSS